MYRGKLLVELATRDSKAPNVRRHDSSRMRGTQIGTPSEEQQLLRDIPEEDSSGKVFHYLQSLPITQDPYEFQDNESTVMEYRYERLVGMSAKEQAMETSNTDIFTQSFSIERLSNEGKNIETHEDNEIIENVCTDTFMTLNPISDNQVCMSSTINDEKAARGGFIPLNINSEAKYPRNSYKKIQILDNRVISAGMVSRGKNEVILPKIQNEINISNSMIITENVLFSGETITEHSEKANEIAIEGYGEPKHKEIVEIMIRNPKVKEKEDIPSYFESASDDESIRFPCDISDEEYVPESHQSSSSSNRTSEDSLNDIIIPKSSKISIRFEYEKKHSEDVISKGSLKNIDLQCGKSIYDKDLCPLCFENVGHFSRHLLRKHSDDESIKKILKMPMKSKERRLAIISLRKKGNFILNTEKHTLKPTRQSKSPENVNEANYFPCSSCLGYYKKSYLWRHKKNCGSKIDNTGSKVQHLTESQTFLATTGILGDHLNKSRLKNEVFCIMRPDEISLTAKTDPLICLYGESYISKHKRKQMNIVASQKIRELARLKIVLQKATTINSFIDALKPELYEHIVAASKIISGFDIETRTFKSSSLALHLGTNLKFLCEVAKKALITKCPLFPILDDEKRDQKLKYINDLRDMIKDHWCNDISSLAQKVLNEKKWEKPKLLPLTEDVNLFNNHISSLANKAYTKLMANENVTENYKLLSETTLCLVLVFNRKRIGEIQFLDVETYHRNFSTINQEECLSSLSELEKKLSSCFKRVVVFGKGSKPVPILFTKRMQLYVDLILDIRKKTDIVPKSNKYVFANPRSADRWMTAASVLRKFASKCGAKNPDLLTSSKFRKQIATILQLMNLENDEMEQIARFMGHTEKTHKEFYRLTEDVYQTAKVVKVLLLLNAGKGNELKGRSLNEIQVEHDVIDSDEEDDKETQRTAICNYDQLVDHGRSLESKEESTDELHKQDEPDLEISSKPKFCSEKRSNRIRWTSTEKKIVLDFFKGHVKTKTAPKKEECENFIRIHEHLFKINDWVRIKTLVYNTYRTQ